MSFYFRAALLVLIASAGLSFAQVEAKKELPKSNDVEVRMGDGSSVRMAIVQDSLSVVTKYGKLTVAMNDITRIEFGLRMPEGTGVKVDQAIRQLGSEDFKKREAASAELVSLGVYAYRAPPAGEQEHRCRGRPPSRRGTRAHSRKSARGTAPHQRP